MKKLFTLITIILIPSILFSQSLKKAKVIKVADGDTYTLVVSKDTIRLRMAEIDCPENKQEYGAVVTQYVRHLILDKTVSIKVKEKPDGFGRFVGYVYISKDKCLNEVLLSKGMAWHYKKYSNKKDNYHYYESLENTARNKKLGLWNNENAIAPWVFRKTKK